jgi:fatty acid desaturase
VASDLSPSPGDSSVAFLKRAALQDDEGVTFREFRKRLTPRYGVVWSQLALGYAALGLVVVGVVVTAGVIPVWIRASIGATGIGLWLAYIQLFFHEAAHFNFAPGRDRNDRLANIWIGAINGLDIAAYRLVHFEHHRRLGTTMDTERSYFDPLNMRFFAEALVGIKALRVLGRRDRVVAALQEGSGASGPGWKQRVLGAVIHLSIVGIALVTGQYALAMAWTLGTLCVLPLLVALRQLLEHRSESAGPNCDYSRVDHGAVNRLFGDGPLASTLGGAGFNRHLLHHWEPQISYTRLRELEAYLGRTSAAEEIERRQSTYWRTFWALVSW